ncbi:MAG: hypothetical protein ACQEXG_14910 [Pseudomonadota bacterium]
MSLLQRLQILADEQEARRRSQASASTGAVPPALPEGAGDGGPPLAGSRAVVALCPQDPVDAVEWVARVCPLLPEDRRYLIGCLELLSPSDVTQACQAYVAHWREAALQEPASHRQENVGRRAANIALRRPHG